MAGSMKKINSITILRVVSIVGVVFQHAWMMNSYTIHGVTRTFPEIGWCSFIVHWISDVVTKSCVPLFFLISGYLFFKGVGEDFLSVKYPDKLKKRIRTLLIPYLIWNLLYFVYNAAFKGLNLTPLSVAGAFFVRPDLLPASYYPAYTPLWFIRELMLLMLLSPLVYYIFVRLPKYCGHLVLFTLFVCGLFSLWPLADPCYPFLSIHGWLFFCAGAWFVIEKKNIFGPISENSLILIGGGYLIISLLDAYLITEYGNDKTRVIHQLSINIGVIMMIVVANRIAARHEWLTKVFVSLSSAVFLIYAMHGLLQLVIFHVIVKIHEPSSHYDLLFIYFFKTFALIALIWVVDKILSRFLPQLHFLLTGGR